MQAGFWQLLSSVAGGILGVSLLSVPKILAGYGPVAYLAWLVGMPAVLSLALMFGRLSTMYPGQGGPYGYARAILGQRAGQLVGRMHLLAMLIQQAAVITLAQEACTLYAPSAYQLGLVAAIVVACGILQTLSPYINLNLSTLLNIIKLSPFFWLILTQLGGLDVDQALTADLHVRTPDFKDALIMIMFAFGGMEFSTVLQTDCIHAPERVVPQAIYYGTILSGVVLFLLQCIAYCTPIYPPDHYTFVLAHMILLWQAIAFGIVIAAHLIAELSANGDLPVATGMLAPTFFATTIPLCIALYVEGTSIHHSFTTLVATCDLIFALIFLACALMYAIKTRSDRVVLCAILSSGIFFWASYTHNSLYLAICATLLSVLYDTTSYSPAQHALQNDCKSIGDVILGCAPCPIFVDLDCTLSYTSVPWDFYRSLGLWDRLEWSLRCVGRSRVESAALSVRYMHRAKPHIKYRTELLSVLKLASQDRAVVLATGSPQEIANIVRQDCPFVRNALVGCIGLHKLDAIKATIGAEDQDFVYIGDSEDDLPIWSVARYPIVIVQDSNVHMLLRWKKAIPRLIYATCN